jgi:hypothetical protein
MKIGLLSISYAEEFEEVPRMKQPAGAPSPSALFFWSTLKSFHVTDVRRSAWHQLVRQTYLLSSDAFCAIVVFHSMEGRLILRAFSIRVSAQRFSR